MRLSIFFIALMTSVSSAVSTEDPGPSPTASVGCEPHGDHWHCDGPASTAVSSGTSRASEVEVSTTSADASPTLPSPTESVGCEPHGDHWHCDGPAETAGASSSATVSASPTMPSPTESSGCEPHGDHWHCDGPAETGSASASASASASTSSGDEGGAGAIGVQISLLVGLSLVAAGLNL